MEHREDHTVAQKEDLQRSHKKRNILIDLAVILVVLIVIGVVWWIGQRPKSEPPSKTPQYSDQQLVVEVNKKYGQHNYLGAINLIKGQKRINEPSVQSLLAGAYANAGDNAKALEVFTKLDRKNKLSEVDAATAAEVAERAQEYNKAIDWYQKAKQKADPKDVDQIAVYQYKIDELEKK